ncbi:MAG: alpha/beta fold hydrolase [Pseudomonadota bacterium]
MTPLILLPGMMCDARLFEAQIAALGTERDVTVAGIDRHNTVAELAQDVLDTAPPKFALAGLSMGGIVAMEVLRQAPDRVERIALMDTNPLAETELVRQRRSPQMAAAREGRLAEVMRDEMKPHYLADGPQKPAILDLCMEMAQNLGPDVFIRQSEALMTRPDQSETLRRANLPALILCGRHDRVCPLERHTLMADLIAGAVLKVIEDAGHLPTLEQPQATTRELENWLRA